MHNIRGHSSCTTLPLVIGLGGYYSVTRNRPRRLLFLSLEIGLVPVTRNRPRRLLFLSLL